MKMTRREMCLLLPGGAFGRGCAVALAGRQDNSLLRLFFVRKVTAKSAASGAQIGNPEGRSWYWQMLDACDHVPREPCTPRTVMCIRNFLLRERHAGVDGDGKTYRWDRDRWFVRSNEEHGVRMWGSRLLLFVVEMGPGASLG